MVKAVASAYYSLPPQDRHDVAIFAHAFAAAGAIDWIGRRYGLPKAISGHQSYWLWGPRNSSGQTVIIVGDTLEGAPHSCNDVTVMAHLHNSYAPVAESPAAVVPHNPKPFGSMAEAWPKVKNWN